MHVSQTTPAEPRKETEAPAEVTKPPEEEREPPVEKTTAPEEETEPPVEKTTAPEEETEPPVKKTTAPRTQPVTTRTPKRRFRRSMCLVLFSYHNLSIGNMSAIDSSWISKLPQLLLSIFYFRLKKEEVYFKKKKTEKQCSPNYLINVYVAVAFV